MSNYQGKTLSNTVKVKDISEYVKLIGSLPSDTDILFNINEECSTVKFSVDGIISLEDRCNDYKKDIQELLCDEQILIIKEIGDEHMDYLAASSYIITNTDIKYIDFDTVITDIVKNTFNTVVSFK